MINDASVYENNFTLLQQIISLKRRVENLEAQSGGGGGGYVLPVASETTLGGIKVGEGLGINHLGYLYTEGGGSYELPVASTETLGGIKVGDNLSIDENGILSAVGGGSGGGEIEVNNRNLYSNVISDDWNTSGFLFGFTFGAHLAFKDYLTPLTFVNTQDNSDTIDLYFPNSSSDGYDYTQGSFLGNYGNNGMLLVKKDYGGDVEIGNLMGQGSFYFSGLDFWNIFDTASQEGVEPLQDYQISGIQSVSGDYPSGGISWATNNGQFFTSYVSGSIRKIFVDYFGETNKRYVWEGNISTNDLIKSGNVENARTWLSGTYFYQR